MKKQIIIRLFGGLGNQLFQYFFSNHLSSKNDVDIFMDISYFTSSRKKHERLRLDDLNLPWTDANNSRLIFHKSYTNKFLKRLPLPRNFKIYRENANLEWMLIPIIEHNTYYDGYWQSYRYLNEVQNIDLLNLSSVLDSKIPYELSLYPWKNAVSIHVRRGDYLISNNHSVLGIDYYINAIELIESNVICPNFFIFSDDIEWAKINLNLKNNSSIFISTKGSDGDIVDLAIMKNCTHHIIANSTYSWWGAWLSWRILKGIVVAPKEWPSRDDSSDICPAEWRRI